MKVAVFSCAKSQREFLNRERQDLKLQYFDCSLSPKTVELCQGFSAVSCFVNDKLDAKTIAQLAAQGIELISMRCAGFNNVDLHACSKHGISVCNVPAYSPHAVAEFALAMILDLNRKVHRAHNRVRDGNFSLEGLLGFDLNGKTVGVVGLGRIGSVFAGIMQGLGCKVIGYDPFVSLDNVSQVELNQLYQQADIISLHCPLTQDNQHLINADAIAQMQNGVMLINTSRGGLIDTRAIIQALKARKIGYLGMDVYEDEADLFFHDWSGDIIQDDLIARLLTFPNVLITGHQAFFTEEALSHIAHTSLNNIMAFFDAQPENLIKLPA